METYSVRPPILPWNLGFQYNCRYRNIGFEPPTFCVYGCGFGYGYRTIWYPHPVFGYPNEEIPRTNYRGEKDAKKEVMVIRWIPPSKDEVKINTDGAVNCNKGLYGIGGLIRDHTGRFIAGFQCSLGHRPPANSVVAELEALKFGLSMAWRMGCKKLVCEVDCQVAINFVSNTNKNLSSLYVDLVMEIRELLSRDWLCTLIHTYREGNFCADMLAKIGSHLEKGRCEVLMESPPPPLMHLLLADSCGVQYPRGYRS